MLKLKKIVWVLLGFLILLTQVAFLRETPLANKRIEQVIKECKELSFGAQSFAFPEVAKRLQEAGIERYYADLVRLEKTFYTQGHETYCDKIPLQEPKSIETEFSEEGVRSAIKDIQGGEINYTNFLHRIMKSGVVSYTVFLKVAQAHYTGRKGEIWVGHFPRKNDLNR